VLEDAPKELRSELAACLGPLLERLPPLQRDALALTEMEGLTQARAAAQLGLSISGMKSRVQRGRAQLKELLTACCEIELDRRGGVRSYRPRNGTCDCRTETPVRPERRLVAKGRDGPDRRSASRACVLCRRAPSLL
jgi:hypothetical protein